MAFAPGVFRSCFSKLSVAASSDGPILPSFVESKVEEYLI